MPNIRWNASILGAAALVVSLSACSGSPGSPTPPAGPEGPSPESSPTLATGESAAAPSSGSLCANAYFPVAEGASWTYQGSGGAMGPYGYTDTISSVRPDGFTLTADFGDLTREQAWACTDEGLVALDYPGGTEARVSAGGTSLVLETTDVTGVTLPSDLAPGATWSQTYSLEGTQTLPDGQSGTATGSASVTSNAVGLESVSVPAGTFTALRMDRTVTLNLVVELSGLEVPVVFTSTETVHLAEGVGMVQTLSSASVSGVSFEDQLALQSYAIP